MLEFSVDHLMAFAEQCATDMTAVVADTRDQPVNILTRFMNESWPNALIVNDPFKPKTDVVPRHEPRNTLAVRYEISVGKIYIDRNFMRTWCRKHNVMFHDLERQLSLDGILLNHSKRLNLGAGTNFSGAGQTTVWDVDAKHEALGNIRLAGTPKNQERKGAA